ncbi:MAG: polysulfide reductase NrfD [Candidatus Eiseniibacteriota bacterium]|nr:MAG: polysulfide reductase NrfD [Candidatus Eisenbacteria bacterium]
MLLKPQSKWTWLVAAYLFLAGVGAGAYITGVVADWLGGEWAGIARIGVVLGFPCVLVGCAFLVADLGKPENFWRAWMRPNTSWIARGTIVITVFMILGAIHFGFWIWPFDSLVDADGARQAIGLLGAIFALGTAIYTGILLGASRPIAFWSTAMLPLLFLVSALSTGVMAVIVGASFAGGAEAAIVKLGKVDILLIIAEIFVVIFYLQGTHRVPESRASAKLVLVESVAPLFWIGVAGLGLVLPLALELAGAFALEGTGPEVAAIVASISGIIGGLFLRQVVLAGGIHAPLKAGRFEYALANT